MKHENVLQKNLAMTSGKNFKLKFRNICNSDCRIFVLLTSYKYCFNDLMVDFVLLWKETTQEMTLNVYLSKGPVCSEI